jgi:hypothetical protein
MQEIRTAKAGGSQAHHRDTPPEDVSSCRGRSPGLRVVASVQSSRNLVIPVTYDGLQLAAHSCGGSAGLAVRLTGFPLSSGQPSPENHDDGQVPPRVRKPLPRNDQWKAPTPDLEGHRERLREALGNTLSDEFVDVILGMFKNPSSSFKPLTLWKIWGLLVLVVFYAAAGCCAAIGRHCGRYLCIPSWWQGTECHSIEPTGVSSSPSSAERRSCRSRAQQTDRVPRIGVLARTLLRD